MTTRVTGVLALPWICDPGRSPNRAAVAALTATSNVARPPASRAADGRRPAATAALPDRPLR